MLNYKGKYYAKRALTRMKAINDSLLSQGIIKARDIGDPNTRVPISKIVQIEFLANEQANIDVKGYSEKIIDSLRFMGNENLYHKDFSKLREFQNELEKIYQDDKITMKEYNYFKAHIRYYRDVKFELEDALIKAEKGIDIPKKGEVITIEVKGSKDGDIITMNNLKEDFSKNRRFYNTNVDYNIAGIKISGQENDDPSYNQYIQLGKEHIIFTNNTDFLITIPYDNQSELDEKRYVVKSTYKDIELETVKLISSKELINQLKQDYNISVSKKAVDNEIIYEIADKTENKNINEKSDFILVGNRMISIENMEKSRNFPSQTINLESPEQFTGTILGEKGARQVFSKKNNKASKVRS